SGARTLAVDLVDRAAVAAAHAVDARHPAATVAVARARLEREELAVVAAERDRREPEQPAEQRPGPGQNRSSSPATLGRTRVDPPRSSSSLACLRSSAATTIRPTPETSSAPPIAPLVAAIAL